MTPADRRPSSTVFDVAVPERRFVDLPHPSECEPRRPLKLPRYLPPRGRPVRDADRWSGGRGPARMVAAPDAGAVRIGMTWRKSFVTSAVFCVKSGRTQYFEGPHEIASYRLRAISHDCTDTQFQPLAMYWDDERGENSYYVDSVEETAAGRLVFRENKAHSAYFNDPKIAGKLAAAERELTRHPLVDFEREIGTELMDPLRWRIAKDIYDDRTIDVGDRSRDAVEDLLVARGEVELGDVWDAIGGPRDDARRVANAMLVRRIVGYRVDRVPVARTHVVRPAVPARPGLLRSFLLALAPGAAG